MQRVESKVQAEDANGGQSLGMLLARGLQHRLAVLTGDIVLRQLLRGLCEDCVCFIELDHFAQQHVASKIGDPRGLLHVMGHDDNCVLLLQLQHQLLDFGCRYRIECRSRLNHENDLGLDRQKTGDAKPLLLIKRQFQSRVMQLVLQQIPEPGTF